MKKIIGVLLLSVFCLSLVGCSKTYHGTDELIEKARKEIPIADADTIEMQYAGMYAKGDRAIAWFISGNEYQAHYYLPMEIEIKDNGANYTFVHTYKPMDRSEDIAVLLWNQEYVFLINNPDCATVRITDTQGEHETNIEKNAYPYVFGYGPIPDSFEYTFLDKKGNELLMR